MKIDSDMKFRLSQNFRARRELKFLLIQRLSSLEFLESLKLFISLGPILAKLSQKFSGDGAGDLYLYLTSSEYPV